MKLAMVAMALLAGPLCASAQKKVDEQDKWGRTALMRAADSWNGLKQARELIAKGANVNLKDHEGQTALHHCAAWQQIDVLRAEDPCGEIAEALLRAGADVNARDKKGMTTLMWAAGWEHEPVVKVLLAHGADTEVQDKSGRTAMVYAAYLGKTSAIVKDLLDAKANVGLMAALIFDDKPLAEKLLKQGASVKVRGPYGETALMRAAEIGSFDIVEAIVAKGADVNAKDDQGITALMLALGARPHRGQMGVYWNKSPASPDRRRIITNLAASGADVNAQNKDGETALAWAVKLGNKECADELIRLGAKPDTWSGFLEMTPLCHAVEQGRLDLVTELLKAGANPNAGEFYFPLQMAVGKEKPNMAIVRALLRAGAKLNRCSRDVRTPLMEAAHVGPAWMVKYLLSIGAKPNLVADRGTTALMLASGWGDPKSVEYLLKAGADFRKRTTQGETALVFAKRNKRTQAIRLLRAAGAKG